MLTQDQFYHWIDTLKKEGNVCPTEQYAKQAFTAGNLSYPDCLNILDKCQKKYQQSEKSRK